MLANPNEESSQMSEVWELKIKWDANWPHPAHTSCELYKTREGCMREITRVQEIPGFLGYTITLKQVKE